MLFVSRTIKSFAVKWPIPSVLSPRPFPSPCFLDTADSLLSGETAELFLAHIIFLTVDFVAKGDTIVLKKLNKDGTWEVIVNGNRYRRFCHVLLLIFSFRQLCLLLIEPNDNLNVNSVMKLNDALVPCLDNSSLLTLQNSPKLSEDAEASRKGSSLVFYRHCLADISHQSRSVSGQAKSLSSALRLLLAEVARNRKILP